MDDGVVSEWWVVVVVSESVEWVIVRPSVSEWARRS